MGVAERKSRLLERIVRLRRAGREHPSDRDIAAVRADLERELGPTVSASLAANLLGVSHTTVRRWMLAGEIPKVMDPSGRDGVPVQALLGLYEDVLRERTRGNRRLHVIEPVMTEARRRASVLDARALVDDDDSIDRHDRALLRSLAYHRAIARRLRRATVDDALHRIWQWRDEGRIDERYARVWEDVLSRPVPEVRKVLIDDSPWATDLRQNSPFAGVLSEAERRKILQEIR